MRAGSALVAILSLGAACGGDTPSGTIVDPACGPVVSLRRGEMRTIADAAALSCFSLATATDASEYVIVAANVAPTPADIATFVVSTRTSATANVVASIAPTNDSIGDQTERRVRESEQRLFAGRSLAGLSATHQAARRTLVAAAPRVGDTISLHVPDASTQDLCTNYSDVKAVVKAMSARATVLLDVAAPARGFTDADFRASANEFDSLILPTDAQWFGSTTDLNADGRITILFTPRINRLTPTGSLGYVGGFFFASDLMPRSNPAQNWSCPSSNEQEIFYLLTPDPDGSVNGNRFSVETALEAARGTTAHELQHMINQGTRQTVTKADRLEVAWMNEGLSHLAEELVGRAARGFADNRRLTWNDVLVDLDDFDSFFRQNLIRYRLWLDRPDLWSPIGTNALTQLAPRGAAWALLRYTTDQFGGTDARGFVRALAAGPEVDVANLEKRTRASFEDIVSGFLVASVADASVGTTSPRLSFLSWSMRDAMTELNGGLYPLRVKTLATADIPAQSPGGSASYFSVARAAGAPATSIRVTTAAGAPVAFAGARAYVIRVK